MFRFFSPYPCNEFRRMGFYSDQSGIFRRYNRDKSAWEFHLSKTKNSILSGAQNKQKDKIAILGSGWLFDVPLEELSKTFSEVWLIDIFHPKYVRQLVKNIPNIHFVVMDISGLALQIYSIVKKSKRISFEVINSLKCEFNFSLLSFDYVVSCNILDQLDEILVSFLKDKRLISAELEIYLRKFVQNEHLRYLPVEKSLLIADVEELIISREGKVIKRNILMHSDLVDKNYKDEWLWEFDNFHTYRDFSKTWFKVRAFEL